MPTIWPVVVWHRTGGLHDPEVGDLQSARRREQDVARLDVPVQHPRVVGRGQRGKHAPQRLVDLRLGQRAESDSVTERVPRQPLHDDERRPVLVAEVVHPDDVRMIEGRGGARLDLESFPDLRLRTQAGMQQLDRNGAAQAGVPTVTDLGHPPESEDVAKFVAAPEEPRSFHGPLVIRGPGPPNPQQTFSSGLINVIGDFSTPDGRTEAEALGVHGGTRASGPTGYRML